MGLLDLFGKRRAADDSRPGAAAASAESRRFALGAIAHLKAVVPAGDPQPVVRLSREDSPVLRPFADGLLVSYVVDAGKSYQYVQQRHLDESGLEADELHRVGLANLARLAGARRTRVQPYGSIFAVLIGGDFEASLLLLESLWEHQFRQFVRGDYAAAVPARDVLAFCDESSAAGRRELRELVVRVSSSPVDHPLASGLYLRTGSAWVARAP